MFEKSSKVFEKIDQKYLDIILSKENEKNLKSVEESIKEDQITPKLDNIFRAFQVCPVEDLKIVIIGQDPYPTAGVANGLSFSVSPGVKIPGSLKKIFDCLYEQKLIKRIPTNGDLTPWAKQGILMLNCYLTTKSGKSNAHKQWEPYTDQLIQDICGLAYGENKNLVFVLWGRFAKEKEKIIKKANEIYGSKHEVLKWGHPSNLNRDNQSDNPKNFKYCDHFKKLSEKFDINWQI